MRLKIRSGVLTLLVFINVVVFSQVDQIKRIEFELQDGFSNFKVSNFGSNGILVQSKYPAENKWKVEHFSKDLTADNSIDFELPNGQYFRESYETKNNLFLLFKSRKGEYTIVKINSKTLDKEEFPGSLPKKAAVLRMDANDEFVYLTTAIKKDRMIYSIDLRSREQNVHPLLILGYKPGAIKVENVQIMDKTNELFVYVNAYIKKEMDVYVFRFDAHGEKKDVMKLSEGIENNITSVSASYISKDEYVYTGTYSKKSSISSEGLYLAKTKNGQMEFIKYYNFLDLDKFLSYLPERKQEKIEKKKAKKALRGKTMSINYLMASHDIIVRDDKYIYIGEAYYPTYRTQTTYVMGANGQMVPQTTTVFDGYQYTHATVAAFDLSGNLLWDQSFELSPGYKPFSVKRFISVSTETKNRINMLYASRRGVYAKSIDLNGRVINDKSYDYIETGNDSDKIKYSYSNMEYWYDKYFLAHGQQKIKNKEVEDKKDKNKKKRVVYFITKISYK